ncbi:B-cell differentiation antigen CD72-like [Mauremys reevesii]|uniref:B-cell differentiation antigen CD72-like n=1 Tax=Mauremys reevesii TaxID=260615 RepID=UPI00193EE668|nr:B-cell differentiation antigen CD72-like [Mauremys reevesii]
MGSAEPRWSTRYLPLGLLGTCLFLLATTIGLGVRYWQVSQHLQQVSRAHEAESSRLSQQVSTKGATLAQTARELEQARQELGQAREDLDQVRQELQQARRELNQARLELEQARREVNQVRPELEHAREELNQARRELEQMRLEESSTKEQLQQREATLKGTKEELARVQEEKREIKEKLKQTESSLSSICPCEQTDCCPAGWVLYRGKCLFVSKEKTTNWEESRKECDRQSAQLLIAKSWDRETMLNFLRNTDVQYWIGLRKDVNKEAQWIDNSPFEKDWSYWNYRYERCGTIRGGVISSDTCYSYQKKPWICEKAPSQPSSYRPWFP